MSFTDAEAGIERTREMEVTNENYPRYKAGANYSDVNKMKGYAKQGYDEWQIAHFLGIVLSCVESHLKPPRQKPGPKPKEAIA